MKNNLFISERYLKHTIQLDYELFTLEFPIRDKAEVIQRIEQFFFEKLQEYSSLKHSKEHLWITYITFNRQDIQMWWDSSEGFGSFIYFEWEKIITAPEPFLTHKCKLIREVAKYYLNSNKVIN